MDRSKLNKYALAIAEGIMLQSKNASLEGAIMAANFKMATISSNMRVTIQLDEEPNSPAPVNVYGLLLAGSLAGKTRGFLTADEWFFNDAYAVIRSKYNELVRQKTASGVVDEKNPVKMWQPVSGAGTTTAFILSTAQDYNTVGVGTLSVMIDELDKFILKDIDIFHTMFEPFDNGNFPSKGLKSEENKDPVKGIAPNFMCYGTYADLFYESAISSKFEGLLTDGYARRCFFFLETDATHEIETIAERKSRRLSSSALKQKNEAIRQHISSLIGKELWNKNIKLTDEALNLWLEFQEESEVKASTIVGNEALKKHYLGRDFSMMKLAGVYASFDKSDLCTVEHVMQAIECTLSSTDSMIRISHKIPRYEKLYLAMRSGKFFTKQDALEKKIVPAHHSQKIEEDFKMFKELAFKYNDIYEEDTINGVIYRKITPLHDTDENRCIISSSPHHAEGYKRNEIPFQAYADYMTNKINYCAMSFKTNHRNLANVDSLFNMIIFDIDEGLNIEVAKMMFNDYYCIIAPTKSHRKEKILPSGTIKPATDRFRIVLLSDKYLNLDTDEYKAFVTNITKFIEIPADSACFDMSHYYEGCEGSEVWIGDCKKKFSVARFIPTHKDIEYSKKSTHKVKAMTPNGLRNFFEAEVKKADEEGTGGVNIMVRACLATKDSMSFTGREQAEQWIYSLYESCEDDSYWTKHDFEKEVLPALDKAW